MVGIRGSAEVISLAALWCCLLRNLLPCVPIAVEELRAVPVDTPKRCADQGPVFTDDCDDSSVVVTVLAWRQLQNGLARKGQPRCWQDQSEVKEAAEHLRLNDQELLRLYVETPSIAAAARQLGVPSSTLASRFYAPSGACAANSSTNCRTVPPWHAPLC